MLLCGARGYGSEGGKVFPFDNIIEKFFKDHHDKEGLKELRTWRTWAKGEFFNINTRFLIYRKFLQRRKLILDPSFEWTPANKECFDLVNKQIYQTELDLYNNLKIIQKNFKELERKGHNGFCSFRAVSGIFYMGGHIKGEDENFPDLLNYGDPLNYSCPAAYCRNKIIRNSLFDPDKNKLIKPTKDWKYEFNESQKECASIKAFQKLPLHKYAGYLFFDSQTYALQDFVNMNIDFRACTNIDYCNSCF